MLESMEQVEKLLHVKLDTTANQKLRHVLSRLSQPYLKDLTTPLVDHEFHSVRIDADVFEIDFGRDHFLGSALDVIRPVLNDFDSRLLELERSELTKSGPKSLRPSSSWWNAVNDHFDSGNWTPDLEALRQSQDDVWRIVSSTMDAGRFIPLEDVSVPMSTFSGMPYLGKTSDDYQSILSDAKWIMSRVQSGRWFEYYYSVLGHRGQSKGLHLLPKQRVVWAYPKATVMVGLSWLQSVLPRMSQLDEFSGWCPYYRTDQVIQSIIDKAYAYGSNVISIDFSKFDATIDPRLVMPVFERTRLAKQLLPILEEFFSSPIMLPGGLKSGRRKGVPSGHAWTNFVDSIANLVCLYYIGHRLGVSVIGSSVLGDDSVVAYDQKINLDDASAAAFEIGLRLNADKSIADDSSCHYLQKLYFRGSGLGGIRSIIRSANSIASLERWSTEMDSLFIVARTWMILEEVRFHPARVQFLEWLKSRDSEQLLLQDPTRVIEKIQSTRIGDENRWKTSLPSVPADFWFAAPKV